MRKILTKKFGKKNLEKKFDKKILIDIITRKIPRGVLATRVCLAWGTRKTRVSRVQNPRNKSRKNFESRDNRLENRVTIDWCKDKAERQNLKEQDYWGALVFDEMKMQVRTNANMSLKFTVGAVSLQEWSLLDISTAQWKTLNLVRISPCFL